MSKQSSETGGDPLVLESPALSPYWADLLADLPAASALLIGPLFGEGDAVALSGPGADAGGAGEGEPWKSLYRGDRAMSGLRAAGTDADDPAALFGERVGARREKGGWLSEEIRRASDEELLGGPAKPADPIRSGPLTVTTENKDGEEEVETPDGPLTNPDADAFRAGLFLLHGDLEGGHKHVQKHEGHANPDFMHGLMHRLQGDFDNATYWFRGVGRHPIYNELSDRAAVLGFRALPWDPTAFTQAYRAAVEGHDPEQLPVVRAIQALEFALLLKHCREEAVEE